MSGPHLSSPPSNQKHPLKNQNKQPPETVSTPLSSKARQVTENKSPSSYTNIQSTVVANDVIHPNLDSQACLDPLAPTEKVGNNRAPQPSLDYSTGGESPSSSSPPKVPQDLFNSSPGDPWHLTFTELREMRTRMTTMDRLEKVTMEIALQLKTITDKTTTMEADVSQNKVHINEMGRDMAGMRKELDKQHKECQLNFKELKEIKKEATQIKEIGRDLTGLRKDVEKRYKDNQTYTKELKEIRKEVSQVKVLSNDLTGLQKEAEKQHKLCQHNSKELKEIKKDFTHTKESGRDWSGLKREVEKQGKDSQRNSKDLEVIKKEISQLNEIKQGVDSMRKEVDHISSNQVNADMVTEMQEEIKVLRQMVDKHQSTIHNLQKVKDDFTTTTHKVVGEMNKLVEAQGEQVHEFKTIRTNVQQESQRQKDLFEDLKSSNQEIQKGTQLQVQQISEDLAYKKLKDQAYNKRNNLVIIGLPEHETNSAYSVAITFFKTTLKIRRRLEVETAYRIGQIPPEGSPYIRPLIVRFAKQPDRNLIWKQRNKIPQVEGNQRIRIQADLPKQLRDEISTLYRVVRATSSMEEFQTATVRDFALYFNGRSYSANQLEQLPHPIRPSSLAVRKSDDTLTFFSKFCVLSNHFPSTFKIQDEVFHSMEHYLAFERAKISQQDHLIEKARQVKDPVEAKSILNLLRTDHTQEWQERRADLAITGLHAKFQQNRHLYEFLQDTGTRRLGEASKNPVWGVGMTLEDESINDTTKWIESGNLLGNLLMQLRTEFAATM